MSKAAKRKLEEKTKFKVAKALKKFPDTISPNFPDIMQLLDEYQKDHDYQGSQPLLDIDILLIQHHLGPLLLRLDALKKDGLKPEHTWLVDIPYSTNNEVRRKIESSSIPISNIATPLLDPLAPYAIIQKQRVMDIIYRLSKKLATKSSSSSLKHLLVIDDGAYFVRALKSMEGIDDSLINAFKGKVAIVEQTTRGHRYFTEGQPTDKSKDRLIYHEHKSFVEKVLAAPVVSIAACNTKRNFEAPFIGEVVTRSVINILKSNSINMKEFQSIVIIGFGAIGKSVFAALRKILGTKFPLHIVDQVITRNNSKMGVTVHKRLSDVHAKLPEGIGIQCIIGCTGTSSFGLNDLKYLSKQAYLVSASSGAIEFSRKKFLDWAGLYNDDGIEIINKQRTRMGGIRSNITLKHGEKELCFLNASFPVNFDGKMECLPTQYIQATHTLLYAAGYQALNAKHVGMREIDSSTDFEIGSKALKYI